MHNSADDDWEWSEEFYFACIDDALGALDMVYGPDESDDELDEDAPWTTKAQIWVWQHKRGYLPIRDRRQMVRKHLVTRSANETSSSNR